MELVLANTSSFDIVIRPDGYVNATKLCQVAGKQWKNYYSNAKTKEFLQALGEFVNLPIKSLVEIGKSRICHTWAHPDVAIHLAQWLSPHVAVAVVGMVRQFAAEHPAQVLRQMNEALRKTMEDSGNLLQGFVYILQTDLVPSRVKIGFSHQNMAALRDRYRTAFPDKTTIWAIEVFDAPEAEADVHLFFDEFREAGEWFARDKVDGYIEYLTSVHGGEIFEWCDDEF